MQKTGTSFFRLSLLLLITFLTGQTSLNAQLVTDTSLTPQQLVQNVLLGPGIIASNITYTGYSRAIGRFYSTNTGLGIDSGIVMTTGSVLANDSIFTNFGPMGPNTIGSDGIGNQINGGDADLTAVAGTTTWDASILAFDFVAMSDSVKFKYVFGSEEYSDYVNSINDVFAFFLTGVSTVLPTTNLALIPNTSTPVTINNVNNGDTIWGPAPGPCMNCAYYVDNPAFNSFNYPVTSPYDFIQYDGFTTVLTASYPVLCGETYHIKIAIADASDHAFDSGVFLEAGSFRAGEVTVASQNTYGGTNDSTLFEGCGQSCLIFKRQGSTNMTDTVALTISGTAGNGTDFYPQIPNQIIFQPGQDSIVICIEAFSDSIAEALENLIITTIPSGPCLLSTQSTLTVYISDVAPITVNAGNDTALCSSAPITLYANAQNGVEPYNYQWSTGATSQSITVNPTVTTTYTVTVSDPCGTAIGYDEVTVYLPNAQALSLNSSPDLNLCTGDPALLLVSAAGGSQPYTYTWTTLAGDPLPNPGGTSNQFTPTMDGTFVVEVREGCGNTRRDTIHITIKDCMVVPPNVFTPNGDGTNDALVFYGLDNFPGSQLFVYNRWGAKIFESTDYHNDWSDQSLSDGTYYYILNLSDGSNITGFITVIKDK